MGLIKSTVGAVSSTLHDQWKEAIRCDDMTGDMLMVRKTTPTGVISNGSIIIVAPGQCAIIYDNGRVIDATAEDGTYTFDNSSTPSFFAGQFKDTFKEMWERFTFDGATSKQQAVFFFNLKEIMDNKFGTATPIPFQDWSHPIPNRMTNTMTPLSVKVRCYGTYTFKMDNPAVFMQELAGTAEIYYKSSVVDQIRSEVLAAFQNVLNELGNSEHKVPVLEMPSQTDEMKQMMEERIYDEPVRRRGIRLVSFAVESVTLEEESEKKINEYELGSNSYMQQGRMTTAYSNAVESAAENAGGAANGFMGVGMMNMATGGMMGGNATAPWQNQNQQGNSQSYNPYENPQQFNQANPQQPVGAGPVSQPTPEQVTKTTVLGTEPAPEQVTKTTVLGTEPAPEQGNASAGSVAGVAYGETQESQNATAQPVSEQGTTTTILGTEPAQEQGNASAGSVAGVTYGELQESQNATAQPVSEQGTATTILGTESAPEQEVNAGQTAESNVVENSQNSENKRVKMCQKCGSMNPADAKFCINCGNQL